MIFQSDLSFLYIRMVVRHLCWQALGNFATVMANVIEEMVGTSEAAAVATESGGDETATRPGTRRRRDRGRDRRSQGRDRRQDGGDGW